MPEAAMSRVAGSREDTGSLGTMLIVDDESAIRESLQTLLELEGYSVDTASDGAEGLARLADHPYDLVLLDFALPERNGIEVLAGNPRARHRAGSHHDHRLRHRGERRQRHAGRRDQLHPEALGQREAAGRCRRTP